MSHEVKQSSVSEAVRRFPTGSFGWIDRRSDFVDGAEWQASREDTTPLVAEIGSLTAQLQAAQATIAEAQKITPTWYRGMYGCPDDMIALTDLRRFLSRADTSAYDAAILAAKAEALREAADDYAAGKITHVGSAIQHIRAWLRTRAASIEQEGADRGRA